jgi:hypothetical protein
VTRRRWWWTSGLLTVVATGCLVGAVHDRAAPVRAVPRGHTTVVVPVATPLPEPAAAVRPRVAPLHLSIPAIHVSQHLLRLGVRSDGTVQVPSPKDAGSPGWFRLGPTPGQLGSAVVLGHVDSMRGPAVFYELRTLQRGDDVDVRLADGALARFRVDRVRTYLNADFPARRVYGSHGFAGLNLVTCGGAYDPDTGYQANVVVFTRLVRVVDAGTR